MRKVSIALRRLGVDEFSNLTRAELRALKREKDPFASDLDEFLQDMQDEDQAPVDSVEASESSDQTSKEPVIPDHLQKEESGSGSPTQVQENEKTHIEATMNEPDSGSDNHSPLERQEVASDSGELTLFSRGEAQNGFSVSFKLRKNGDRRNNGALTVYSHTSESQLSGLGESEDNAFELSVPADSYVRLGPDRSARGWEHLKLQGPPELFATDKLEKEEETVPMIPVPDEEPGSLWAVPLEVFARTQTNLALTNLAEQPAVVRLYLLDRKGNRLAGSLDPKLNPLSPGCQVVEPVDRFFPELIGLDEFYGTIIVRVERERPIWAMGIIGDDPKNYTVRRALNMNVDLEGIKAKMAKELEEIAAREEALQKQMSHLEAVLQLAGTSDGSAVNSSAAQSAASEPAPGFAEQTG